MRRAVQPGIVYDSAGPPKLEPATSSARRGPLSLATGRSEVRCPRLALALLHPPNPDRRGARLASIPAEALLRRHVDRLSPASCSAAGRKPSTSPANLKAAKDALAEAESLATAIGAGPNPSLGPWPWPSPDLSLQYVTRCDAAPPNFIGMGGGVLVPPWIERRNGRESQRYRAIVDVDDLLVASDLVALLTHVKLFPPRGGHRAEKLPGSITMPSGE